MTRRLGAAFVTSVLAAVLIACQPPPPPDGRDLGFGIDLIRTTLTPGEQLTIHASINNYGSVPATGVAVTYIAPEHVQVEGVTTTGGPCAVSPANDQVWTCQIVDLTPNAPLALGSSAQIYLTITGITEGPVQDHTLIAVSDASEADPDPHPNLLTFPVTVGPASKVDLKVTPTVSVLGGPGIVVGDTTTISTSVSIGVYSGPTPPAVMGLSLTQQVPESLTIESATFREDTNFSPQIGSCDVVGQTITCDTDGQLFDGPNWKLATVVTATEVGPFTVSSTVASPHPEYDIYPNTVELTETVYAQPFFFDPVHVGPAYVGVPFTMDVAWVAGPYALEARVTVPAGLRLDGISVRDSAGTYQPVACSGTGPVVVTCPVALIPRADIRLTLTGLQPVDDAPVSVRVYAAEAANLSTTGTVDVVPAGSIAGIATGPGGAPAGGVEVRLFATSDFFFPRAVTTTAADGSYSFPNLVPGTYKVRFLASGGSGLVGNWWYGDVATGAASPVITVASGSVFSDIDVSIPAAP